VLNRGVLRAMGLMAVLATLAAVPRTLGQDAPPRGYDRWYVIELQGQRAGHMHERQTVDEEGRLKTTGEIKFKVSRLGSDINVSMSTEFVETQAGEPVSMSSLQNLGLVELEQRFRFTEDGIEQRTRQSGRTTRQSHPRADGTWLTPGQVRQFVAKRLEAGATEITYATVDPNQGVKPVVMKHTVEGPTTVEAMGKVVPAVKWTVVQSAMPGVTSTEYVDARGMPIRSEVDFGGITMTVLASEKEIALSPFSAPELMAQSLVMPKGDIPNPRATRRATYVLDLKDGDLSDVPGVGAQRVEPIEDGRLRVIVDLDAPLAASPDDLARRADFLKATATVDAEDPVIRRLAARALAKVADGASDQERAEALRRFVHSYIDKKSLGVGFATASEVAVIKQGDCTEHAVLLVALLRAAGIPAQGVSGLVYVDQFVGEEKVFGYHMWAQALLTGDDGVARWIDLDATLDAQQPYDAAHIALVASDLSDDGMINSMVPIATMLGRLGITVEAVE